LLLCVSGPWSMESALADRRPPMFVSGRGQANAPADRFVCLPSGALIT